MPKEKWMQEALDHKTKGALHRQLEIPVNERIPKTLMEKIVKTPIGQRIRNPTQIGKRRILVTRKLKQRAVPALTAGYGHFPRKKR